MGGEERTHNKQITPHRRKCRVKNENEKAPGRISRAEVWVLRWVLGGRGLYFCCGGLALIIFTEQAVSCPKVTL